MLILSQVSKRLNTFFVFSVQNDLGWFGRNWIPPTVFRKLKKSKPIRRCGKPGCLNRSHQFGVCGRHKTYAFVCNDKLYQIMVNQMKETIQLLKQEDAILGDDILNVQAAFGNNIAGPQVRPFLPRYQTAGRMLLKIRTDILDYQRHIDADLVCNTSTRLRHSLLSDGNICNCSYCLLH
jgi:hypothetical protein